MTSNRYPHPRVALTTLGCRVNHSETEAIARRFVAAGYQWVAWDEPADVYVINTCTVTHVADRKSRGLIHQASRRNPGALVVVTGCYATRETAALAAIPGVDLVLPNGDKDRLVELVVKDKGGRMREGREAVVHPPSLTPHPFMHTRAFLKVQDGCDAFCTYCIVPSVRGAPRSLPVLEVIAQVNALVAAGYREVVLVGIHLAAYGQRDEGRSRQEETQGSKSGDLGDLIRAVLEQTRLARLRLSSVEPEDFRPEWLAPAATNPRLCPHLHLPLQSGCDRTLRRMGRRYTVSQYAAILAAVRDQVPDLAVTTDLIVGFPGETDADFAESLAQAGQFGFARMHVFPFSPRPGTPAARLPDRVPPATIQARMRAALALSDRAGREFRRHWLGRVTAVLWEERDAAGRWCGYTPHYLRVEAEHPGNWHNQITPARLERLTPNGLAATILP